MKRLLAALLFGAALGTLAQAQGPAAGGTAAAQRTSDVVPLETFAEFPAIQGPRMSPGGKVIAAKIRFQGGQALAILPIGAGAKPQIIAKDGAFDEAGDFVIESWRWADDDNLVIELVSRQFFWNQWIDATRLIAYNRSSGKTTPLAWRGSKFTASKILWMSSEGPPTILLERTPESESFERLGLPEVVKVDVLTGKVTDIVQRASPSIHSWYADGKGVVRLGTGFDRDSGKLTAMYRRDAGSSLETIFSERYDRFEGAPLPQIFLNEPDRALATSRKDGYAAVYELDLKTMTLGRKVFGVQNYDIEGVSAGRTGDRLEAVFAVEHRPTAYYFEPRLKEIQQMLDETFGRGNAYIVSTDRAREMIVARVARPGAPGAFYVYDTRTGGMSRLGWINATIGDRQLNPVKTIRYKASDGKEIEAVLTTPRHRAGEKNLPLIVLPHGGPWARDDESWPYVPWAQPLAELGYVVIQPNFRGSSGYGREWEKASDGNWGERMQDDLNDAVTHLAAQGIADPGRVCMMGWSYGGYAASRAAQRDGSKYRCAISGAGVHDLPTMVDYDKDYLGTYAARTALGAAGKLRAVSPGLHAREFSAPILIIHGEKDRRVPVRQSRDLVGRLKAAGKVEGRDFVYVELPRETHNLLLESSRLRVLQEVKKFLDRHNPAG
ncbi:MAG TPA: alpha/beta fold hydrolase [Allosphingosinicella sp.]|nr:alpha/beta fold hydrolase [Allosphingosinicella sp.]